MPNLTPNSKATITLATAAAIVGSLLYAGWVANDLLHGIKDELSFLRAEVRSSWTVRDMRDYNTELQINNPTVHVPDVARIQRSNRTP